jgi:hypothetical protein
MTSRPVRRAIVLSAPVGAPGMVGVVKKGENGRANADAACLGGEVARGQVRRAKSSLTRVFRLRWNRLPVDPL